MSTKTSVLLFGLTLLLLVGGLYLATKKPSGTVGNLDNYAKCLTEKGMTMYGAYWCQHCKNIKKLFGDSFKYVQYVECTVETKTCTDKGVNGYPTFIFSDGSRLEGEITLSDFANKTSCPLPNATQ